MKIGGRHYRSIWLDEATGLPTILDQTRLPFEIALRTLASLEDVAEASLTLRMGFADFADYWEPLLGGQGPFGGFVAGLSPERRGRIRTLVREAYLAGGEDGPRSMTATAWAARGRVA